MRKIRVKRCLKTGVFVLILMLLIALFTKLFKPLFKDQYDRTSGFYEMEEDTAEVLFMGSSVMYFAVSANELYEEYGICSYNLATNSQPVLTTYYRLKEAYQLHSSSLKAVVLDAAMITRSTGEENYQNAIWGMQSTFIKSQAVKDITDSLEGFLSYMVPLTAWHTRWSELTVYDYAAFDAENNRSWLKGYYYSSELAVEESSFDEIGIPPYIVLTDETADLYDEAVLYLERIISFCDEKGIELILVKTPTSGGEWGDKKHNAVTQLAEEYGIAFLDFNYTPYIEEIDFSAAEDLRDEKHMNYEGMLKFTSWIGEYLTENCALTDVRGLDAYAFMEDDLETYRSYIQAQQEQETQADADTTEQLYLYNLRCSDAYLVKTLQVQTDPVDMETILEVFSEDETYEIRIEETQEESADAGTQIVVYNKVTELVVCTVTFDEEGNAVFQDT